MIFNQVTYENASIVMQSPPILLWLFLSWIIPLLIYLLIGSVVKGRSPSGTISSKPMIYSPNFYWAILIWGLIQLSFFILLIFPLILRL